jgi:hypothetical protein
MSMAVRYRRYLSHAECLRLCSICRRRPDLGAMLRFVDDIATGHRSTRRQESTMEFLAFDAVGQS